MLDWQQGAIIQGCMLLYKTATVSMPTSHPERSKCRNICFTSKKSSTPNIMSSGVHAGALQAVADVLETLASAAVAVQVIVLGASVFMPPALPRGPQRPPLVPLTPTKPPSADRQKAGAAEGTVSLGLLPVTGEIPGSPGVTAPAASSRINQNLVQILLPSDPADRKVCS